MEDPYTEREARIHVVRTRELLGAAGNRTDSVQGILAGLSLFDDVSRTEEPKNGQAAKSDQDELRAIGDFKFDAPASLDLLCPLSQPPAPKPIKSIALSQWNPPPHHLRIKGHLLYVQVVTNEGRSFEITSSVTGFFVNSSTNSSFDPFPNPAHLDWATHSLLTLIPKLSPSFTAKFQALQDFNAKKDPLAACQLTNAIPASPWAVPSSSSSQSAHLPDATRNQEGYLIAGTDGNETLRDWNEEFQSTRELSKEAVHERVQKERITSKLFADYNEAAARGAVLVAREELTALNPTEARDAQIFVYNNVFFSYGADGVGTFTTEGGDEAARVAVAKDVAGVRAINQLDITGLYTPGTVVVDYLGRRIVAQSIVPGIFKQREPGEHQIDYGGVDGKDIIADDNAFAPLFEQIAKGLKVKKHPVWDKDKKRHDLETSVETKGLLGTDGRKYVLDLYRTTPLDVVWLETHWSERDGEGKPSDESKPYPHRMATLRPELVDAYWKLKLREFIKKELDRREQSSKESSNSSPEVEAKVTEDENPSVTKEAKQDEKTADEKTADEAPQDQKTRVESDQQDDAGQERVDVSDFAFGLNPDVFSGQEPQTESEKAQWAEDEAEVRSACQYLTSVVIPRLV